MAERDYVQAALCNTSFVFISIQGIVNIYKMGTKMDSVKPLYIVGTRWKLGENKEV